MDIAIPLARDRHQYQELRYTLRSIEKYLTGYRDIYLIGEKPDWITGVIQIHLNDIAGRKAFSIFRKMMVAAKNERVSNQFISWADDTYLLKKLEAKNIKAWYDGTLKEWTEKNINSLYLQVIKNTYNVFPEGLFYNVHTPCIYDKLKFIEMRKYNFSTTELLVKSMYFNTNPSTSVKMKDPKTSKSTFYSSSLRLRVDELNILKEHFPNPSRYEADNKTYNKAGSGMAEATG